MKQPKKNLTEVQRLRAVNKDLRGALKAANKRIEYWYGEWRSLRVKVAELAKAMRNL